MIPSYGSLRGLSKATMAEKRGMRTRSRTAAEKLEGTPALARCQSPKLDEMSVRSTAWNGSAVRGRRGAAAAAASDESWNAASPATPYSVHMPSCSPPATRSMLATRTPRCTVAPHSARMLLGKVCMPPVPTKTGAEFDGRPKKSATSDPSAHSSVARSEKSSRRLRGEEAARRAVL